MEDPDHPNISATLWRSVSDHDAKRYYFESTIRPAVFWVDLDKVDLSAGAPTMTLDVLGSKGLADEVSDRFEPAEPFKWLAA
jgi:choloylglycine hydrolase